MSPRAKRDRRPTFHSPEALGYTLAGMLVALVILLGVAVAADLQSSWLAYRINDIHVKAKQETHSLWRQELPELAQQESKLRRARWSYREMRAAMLVLSVPTFVVAGIFYLLWLRRTYRSLPDLGVTPRYTTMEVILSQIWPGWNLYLNARAFTDIARSAEGPGCSVTGSRFRICGWLGAMAILLAVPFVGLANITQNGGGHLTIQARYLIIRAACTAVPIIAMLWLIFVVLRLGRGQMQRWRTLTMEIATGRTARADDDPIPSPPGPPSYASLP